MQVDEMWNADFGEWICQRSSLEEKEIEGKVVDTQVTLIRVTIHKVVRLVRDMMWGS